MEEEWVKWVLCILCFTFIGYETTHVCTSTSQWSLEIFYINCKIHQTQKRYSSPVDQHWSKQWAPNSSCTVLKVRPWLVRTAHGTYVFPADNGLLDPQKFKSYVSAHLLQLCQIVWVIGQLWKQQKRKSIKLIRNFKRHLCLVISKENVLRYISNIVNQPNGHV